MKKFITFLLLIAGLYLLLLIPMPENKSEPQKASQIPFIWDQDALWENLEIAFIQAKAIPSEELDSIVRDMAFKNDSILNAYKDKAIKPEDDFYPLIERRFFQIAPLIAAQENKSDWHVRFYNRVRKKIKREGKREDVEKRRENMPGRLK